jgi:hypothetical protein
LDIVELEVGVVVMVERMADRKVIHMAMLQLLSHRMEIVQEVGEDIDLKLDQMGYMNQMS